MPRAAVAQAVKAQPRIAVGQGRPAGPPAATSQGVGRLAKPQGFNREWNTFQKGQAAQSGAAPFKPAPWDAAYEQSENAANKRFNNAGTTLASQRLATQQEYGLDPGFNDYSSNPYSRAALLEQTFQRGNRANINAQAARGQLYAGSTQNREGYNRAANAQNKDALHRSYDAALKGIENKEREAEEQRNEEISNAGWKRVENAGKAELEPETAPEKRGGNRGNNKGRNRGGKGNRRR